MSKTRNLIEYHEITTCKYEDMPYFKQVNLKNNFYLSPYFIMICFSNKKDFIKSFSQFSICTLTTKRSKGINCFRTHYTYLEYNKKNQKIRRHHNVYYAKFNRVSWHRYL